MPTTLHVLTPKVDYPRSSQRNNINAAIVALCNDLGINPNTITPTAPNANPTSVNNYLNMLAYIFLNMTGGYNYNNPGASNNWSTAGVPMRKILGGGGGGNTIAGNSGEVCCYCRDADLQSGAQSAYAIMGYSGTLSNLYIETLTSQPGTGSLVFQSYVIGYSTVAGPVVTVAAGGGAAIASSSASPITFNPGDKILVLATNNASTTSAQIGQVTMELDQTG